MPTLKPLDVSLSNLIRHQQIVLNVVSVLKELIENSLDAGADHIDICLKNYGLDSIEVSDNGYGIHSDDFEHFASKNYTSKLSSIEELNKVSTFGFRGEAISSICSMSTFRCITRHKSMDCGSDIIFEKSGMIKQITSVARDIGTTIIVSELFHGVPVRRRELEKNIKIDYSNVLRLIEAFLIMNPTCSFSCFNWTISTKSKNSISKVPVCNFKKSSDTWNRLKDIFGEKQLQDLIRIEHTDFLESNDQSQCNISSDINYDFDSIPSRGCVKFDGYISNVNGISSKCHKNSQYIFINKRWCQQSKFIKSINKTYQSCSCSNRLPFLVLFITLPENMIDVNVSTHKDIVIIKKDTYILTILKRHIENLLGSQQNIIYHSFTQPEINEIYFDKKLPKLDCSSITNEVDLHKSKQKKIDCVPMLNSSNESSNVYNMELFTPLKATLNDNTIKNSKFLPSLEKLENFVFNERENETNDKSKINSFSLTSFEDAIIERKNTKKEIIYDEYEFKKFCSQNITVDYSDFISDILATRHLETDQMDCVDETDELVKDLCHTSNENIQNIGFATKFYRKWFNEMKIVGQFNHGFIIAEYCGALYIIDQHAADEKFNYERLMSNLKINSQRLLRPINLKLTPFQFDQLLSNRNQLSKVGFEFDIDIKERIVNVSAIPYMNNSFLFNEHEIIELLEHPSQSFCNSNSIQLSQDSMLASIEDVNNNDPDFNESTDFIKKDSVFENSSLFTNKISQMFATKACRSSIMIGKPLTYQIMKKIINNLATLKHPWNCPHGRPTIRHLLNL